VPILIVGFAEGLQTGLIVLVFYLVVQNLEGNFLVPMIQHRVVNLAPVLLISVQVLMSALFGAMGLIIAAPLTLVAMVMVKKLYVEDMLGEPPKLAVRRHLPPPCSSTRSSAISSRSAANSRCARQLAVSGLCLLTDEEGGEGSP
jgi:hypothetical protein